MKTIREHIETLKDEIKEKVYYNIKHFSGNTKEDFLDSIHADTLEGALAACFTWDLTNEIGQGFNYWWSLSTSPEKYIKVDPTKLEIDGTEIEVLITDFNEFPEDIENAEVIRSKKTNSAFINKKFFGAWVSKYFREVPLDALSVIFRMYKNQEGLKSVCLWFLGDEHLYYDHVLRGSKDDNRPISKSYCKNIVDSIKHISDEMSTVGDIIELFTPKTTE